VSSELIKSKPRDIIMTSSNQVPNSSESNPKANQVPNSTAGSRVPNSSPQARVPNSSPQASDSNSKTSQKTVVAVDTPKWSIPSNPFQPLVNQRRYSGQTLKIVDTDGRVTIITEQLLYLALVDGGTRVLDVAPWTGKSLPIVMGD
jgi:hypothetical protein